MKKNIVKTLLLLFAMFVAASCGKDEKEISFDALPDAARQFVKQHFPTAECTRAVHDKGDGTTEYEVWLSDGTELEFDEQGDWKSVDCKFSTLPGGILPEAIQSDIATRYPQSVAYKVEKKLGGYEVDIAGWELYYNQQSTFIRAERN